MDTKLYFHSYTIANQIFSLIDFVTEATNTEIESFGDIDGINASTENIKHIANIKTRRLIKLLSNTDNIATFMRKTSRTRNSLLRKYGVNAQINDNGKIEKNAYSYTDRREYPIYRYNSYKINLMID